MLKEEQIKELISKYLIMLLASHEGYKVAEDNLDNGVDLTIKSVRRYELMGKARFMNTGKAVDIQLKCTTTKSSKRKNDKIIFDLTVKNYNDLLIRQREEEVIPLILIIVILPDLEKPWIETRLEEVIINAEKYWFFPKNDLEISKNIGKTRISIPVKNTINTTFFNTIFHHFHGNAT